MPVKKTNNPKDDKKKPKLKKKVTKKKSPAKKKAAPKKPKKKAPKKAASKRAVKKNIEKAVDQIPGLIVEHVERPTPPPLPSRPSLEPHLQYQPSRNGTLWLWTGVLLVTVTIFGLWIFNTTTLFYDFQNAPKSEERQIWEEAADDLGAILTSIAEDDTDPIREELEELRETVDEEEQTKEDITSTLKEILVNTATTTTSTVSEE